MSNNLNMSVEIVGGQDAEGQFVELCRDMAGDQSTYDMYKRDTGIDLAEAFLSHEPAHRATTSEYFDWVAIRYWGIECPLMRDEDLEDVKKFIDEFGKESVSCRTDHLKGIKQHVGKSMIARKSGKIAAVLMVMDKHIELALSTAKGMASQLITSLPAGIYSLHLHDNNKRGLKLFEKFSLRKIGRMSNDVGMGFYTVEIKRE